MLPDLVKIRSNPSTICIFIIRYYYPFCKRKFISQIVCLLLWFWLSISGTAADRVIYTPHSGFIQNVILTVKFTFSAYSKLNCAPADPPDAVQFHHKCRSDIERTSCSISRYINVSSNTPGNFGQIKNAVNISTTNFVIISETDIFRGSKIKMERITRLELATSTLARWRSTR